MSVQYFNTFTEARAVPGPSVIAWIGPRNIVVRTGADIPQTNTAELVVTAWQLREALFQAGKLDEVEAAVATQSAMRQRLWANSATFGRDWRAMENIKNKIAGMNSEDWTAIFIAAQSLTPDSV